MKLRLVIIVNMCVQAKLYGSYFCGDYSTGCPRMSDTQVSLHNFGSTVSISIL